jgi:hypothetical protein
MVDDGGIIWAAVFNCAVGLRWGAGVLGEAVNEFRRSWDRLHFPGDYEDDKESENAC